MADYKNIKGFNIQYLDSDPPNPIEGQMWFNSTTQTLKGAEAATIVDATWASGGDLNTARSELAGTGTQTAALAIAGSNPPVSVLYAIVESYNGSSWTEVGDVNTARRILGGAGTTTAALVFAGFDSVAVTAATELYNGTSWTEVNDLSNAAYNRAGSGTQTAALAFGGTPPPGLSFLTATEEFDGTSWTAGGSLPQGLQDMGGMGPQTATLSVGGETYPGTVITEAYQYNGTSWSGAGTASTPRRAGRGSGTSTSGLAYGGRNPGAGNGTSTTEFWNGSAWTEVADLSTAKYAMASSQLGSSSSALSAGGWAPTATASTEEWTVPDSVIKTFTTS
jgi:hypothetical protein